MSTKPTILLVHGGWQSPSVWTFVMPLLEKAGYSVYPVLLKSPGMAPAAPDFSCDVDAIRSSVEAVLECGKDAVVVMHSYAAIAGCEALKMFHDEMKGYAHGGDGGDGWVASDSSAVKRDLDTKHAHRGDGDSDAVVPAKYISRRGRIVHLAFIVGMVMPVGKGLWTPERTEWDGFELKRFLFPTHLPRLPPLPLLISHVQARRRGSLQGADAHGVWGGDCTRTDRNLGGRGAFADDQSAGEGGGVYSAGGGRGSRGCGESTMTGPESNEVMHN
ncbi:conserved hypothetical protein [Histoplasma capsulatum G186AR]|uniref:AB hydrolase-1 domain-containing protein n=1 Tax=Ajellomyces capsulatus (strain G186AR / H82 / ATCC MYA-2454 / RMSCC 2432) TaxID=447093 RepID=C0NZH6_AJECG|nr:uncharacterized protein HCBG_08556 [Histoplasma capsulatum G186AR]EEH03224.1 conserved hypothetical protein [Histoplasma capsulatum G186AR]